MLVPFLHNDTIRTRIGAARIPLFGFRKRYDEQYERFKNIKSDILELQHLIELIHQERKSYDQEGYICCDI